MNHDQIPSKIPLFSLVFTMCSPVFTNCSPVFTSFHQFSPAVSPIFAIFHHFSPFFTIFRHFSPLFHHFSPFSPRFRSVSTSGSTIPVACLELRQICGGRGRGVATRRRSWRRICGRSVWMTWRVGKSPFWMGIMIPTYPNWLSREWMG